MSIFPKDFGTDYEPDSAPSRMRWIREQGTRRLLTGIAVLVGIWLVVSQVYDRWLLQKHWPLLGAHANGLTVVGTLNSRESYDRNLFKIINANKSSRVVITEFGWKSIFDERNGPLFTDVSANAIRVARDQDGVVADYLLAPFLRAMVEYQMGNSSAFKQVREDLSIVIPKHTKDGAEEKTTLGALIGRFSGVDVDRGERTREGEGSGSGREKEDVVSVSSETLLASCPIVLNDDQVEGASMEEVQGNLLTPTTYTIHLMLTNEGRSRFFQWSHDHINENVVFVLNGEVVAAPRITQTLNVSDFTISNVQDLKGAKALVAYFDGKHK